MLSVEYPKRELHMKTKKLLGNFLVAFAPIFFGSFVFVGVIENYKDDSVFKSRLLENYFKPARTSSDDCMRAQGEFVEKYPLYAASLVLMFEELQHLADNPKLQNAYDYELLLRATVENHNEANADLDRLNIEVKKCRIDVQRKLEDLALVTGSFDEYSENLSVRVSKIEAAEKNRTERVDQLLSEYKAEFDYRDKVRGFLASPPSTNDEWKTAIEQFSSLLPIVEGSAKISMETEALISNAEIDFYEKSRRSSSNKINSMFEQGFISWLF